MKKNKGLSLIEALVGISIILIILVLTVIALYAVKKESRDIKRTSDMEVLRSVMANVKIQYGGYDQAGCALGAMFNCTEGNLAKIMPTIVNFKDPKGTALCSQDCTQACQYSLNYVTAEDFEVMFFLEKGLGNYTDPGCYLLTANGISKK